MKSSNPPLHATVYQLQRLRCNLCGEIFKADAPEGIGEDKYDEASGAMIALLKYGAGMPFNRIGQLQSGLGIPLPASTQWDVVEQAGNLIYPAYEELIRQTAQGDIIYNDDTTMKILTLMKQNNAIDDHDRSERKGIFTTGIMSTLNDRKKIEPNSGLGQAISYMQNHWKKLILFLRVPKAPLDNNLCERALKKAILHRKNALFYKTEHGAYIGNMFMSLIYTCSLGDINPYKYLISLQEHSSELFKHPEKWLPWNYNVINKPATS